MDGMTAIRYIREEFSNEIACIAITASTLKQDIDQILQVGFNDFIGKPFRFEWIYNCLKKCLSVEFEYQTAEEVIVEEPQIGSDLTQVVLPKQIYDSLLEAAELCNLTALETITTELSTGTAEMKILAKEFQAYLADYDTDGILDRLNEVAHVEE